MRGLPKYRSGDVVPIRPLGSELPNAATETLIRKDDLEIARIVLRSGEQHAAYNAVGHVVVQCIEGLVKVVLEGIKCELKPGDLMHLTPGTRHSLYGTHDSAILFLGMNPVRPQPEREPAAFDNAEVMSRDTGPGSTPPAKPTIKSNSRPSSS